MTEISKVLFLEEAESDKGRVGDIKSRAQTVVDGKLKSRSVKQRMALLLAAIALPFMSVACNSFSPIVNFSSPFAESSAMKEERNELLTDEQLKEANIRIVQTPDVELSLKRSVFDFAVFKDAVDGRLEELVVVLVDHPSLSWNAGRKLPKDIKEAYQVGIVNPYERSAKEWTSELNVEQLERAMASESENTSTIGLIVRFDGRYIYPPGSDLIDYMEKYSPGEAERLKRQSDALAPKLKNKVKDKVFIFIAVGGKRKPHPNQSYLSPSQFEEIPGAYGPNGYSNGTYRYTGSPTAGWVLRHESSHYVGGSFSRSEYDADTGMFESVEDAWKRRQNEDESGYPFVFKTAEGITTTKNIAKQDSGNPMV